VLFPLSYVREEPPAGVEPTPRPYKGRVLAVDTTEAKWRRRESNPLLLGANEVLFHKSFIPKVRTDGVESRYALSYARLQRAELTSAQRPHDKGRPAGFEPEPRGSRPRMLPLHHSHHERGRPDSNRRPLA
jgi:hypothetical protein